MKLSLTEVQIGLIFVHIVNLLIYRISKGCEPVAAQGVHGDSIIQKLRQWDRLHLVQVEVPSMARPRYGVVIVVEACGRYIWLAYIENGCLECMDLSYRYRLSPGWPAFCCPPRPTSPHIPYSLSHRDTPEDVPDRTPRTPLSRPSVLHRSKKLHYPDKILVFGHTPTRILGGGDKILRREPPPLAIHSLRAAI